MIYSNEVARLSLVSSKAVDFLTANDMTTIEEGRYGLGGGDYVNIESYTSKDRAVSCYEAHRDYADIQMVLEGRELIEVHPLEGLDTCTPYDAGRDIEFFSNEAKGEVFLMKPGRFMLLDPNDGHMPQLMINGGERVKKAVFKIRLNKMPTCVKYLVMDVDGTLTDGSVYTGAEGELFKGFDVKDGFGIHELLPRLGVKPVIITGRDSVMLANRCNELRIDELYQGVSDKLSVLESIVGSDGLGAVCYVGDDLNDLACMKAVAAAGGFVACPNDAVAEIKAEADYVLGRAGGHGAIRELIELLRLHI